MKPRHKKVLVGSALDIAARIQISRTFKTDIEHRIEKQENKVEETELVDVLVM